MRTHNIPPYFIKIEEIFILPPDLALLSTLIGSNYPCIELIFMAPKVFESLKFDCIRMGKRPFVIKYQLSIGWWFDLVELGIS